MTTGTISVTVDAHDLPRGTVLAAEVISLGTGEHRSVLLPGGDRIDLSVPAGLYLVRASLPSGQLMSNSTSVEDSSTAEVHLEPAAIYAPPTKGAADASSEMVWVRLWRGGEVVPWPDDCREVADYGELTVDLPGLDGAEAIEVGSEIHARRIVRLPPAPSCRIHFDLVAQEADFDDGIRIRAWGSDPRAESMLRYLSSGQIAAAHALVPPVDAWPDFASGGEMACVTGLVLARLPQSAEFDTWLDGSDDGSDDSDLAVVRAWGLLRRPDAAEQRRGRDLILASATDCPPAFTEALRLQFDAVRRVATAVPDDGEARTALAAVQRFASACDWTSPQTAYWGASPGDPTLRRNTSEPSDTRVSWLRVGR